MTKQLRAAAQVFDRNFAGDKPKCSLAEAAATWVDYFGTDSKEKAKSWQRLARSSAIQFVFAMEMLQWFALGKGPNGPTSWRHTRICSRMKCRNGSGGLLPRSVLGMPCVLRGGHPEVGRTLLRGVRHGRCQGEQEGQEKRRSAGDPLLEAGLHLKVFLGLEVLPASLLLHLQRKARRNPRRIRR